MINTSTLVKSWFIVFLKSILAGVMIAMVSAIYVNSSNKIIGAFIFALGLMAIMEFGFTLYTGKIGFLFDVYMPDISDRAIYVYHIVHNIVHNIALMIVYFVGNFLGAIATMLFTNVDTTEMVTTKMANSSWLVFGKAVMCGMLIYIAVVGFKSNMLSKNSMQNKYLFTMYAIPCFIIGRGEHCIADACYMVLAKGCNWDAMAKFLLLVVLGNSVGSIVLHELSKLVINFPKVGANE